MGCHPSILLAACSALPSCWALPFAILGAGIHESQTVATTPVGEPARCHGGITAGVMQLAGAWQPAATAPWGAIDADVRIEDGPLWFSSFLGVGYTEDAPAALPWPVDATMTIDNGIGLRHYRAFGVLEPFVGAGFAFVDRRARGADGAPGEATDLGFGIFGELGLDVVVVESCSLGAFVRQYHGEDATLHERELPGAQTTFGLRLGWRF